MKGMLGALHTNVCRRTAVWIGSPRRCSWIASLFFRRSCDP